MKKTTWRLAVLVVLASTVAVRAAQPSPHAHNDKTVAGPEWSALIGDMEKMHGDMASVAPSGEGDVDFVRMMLPHHQAAIDMAKTQLAYGKDPQMRRLAQEIIADQQSEIELMQLWLKQHQSSSRQVEQPPAFQASKEQ